MTDKQYHSYIAKCNAIEPGEWTMIKEHQIWGRCPTFKNNNTGKVLYAFTVLLLDEHGCTNYLRDNYRPPYIPGTPETELACSLGEGVALIPAIDRARRFV